VLLGRSGGLSDEQIASLMAEPLPGALFTLRERAIVRYARTLARMEPVDDELYSELERHFDAQQIIELCFVGGLAGLVNRFHATFHTDLDDDTLERLGTSCPLPVPVLPAP
jgi:alkylhydroperoxidase family enzyme